MSPGCELCYAERDSKRYGFSIWGKDGERRFFGEKHWNEPRKWNAEAKAAGVRRKVFCASMADVFEEHPQLDAQRVKLWPLVEECDWLDWLLLTKRPENMTRMAPWKLWPRNAWAGTTVESQKYADSRIPALLDVASWIHWIS